MLELVIFAVLIGSGVYLLEFLREKKPVPEFTEEQIKQEWRELGFFCEVDHDKKVWTLTGSRAGLLYFSDLLLGYVTDSRNASNGSRKKYGPYGTLEVMTAPDAGLGNSIRGSSTALTHLAELVEEKLAFAQAGEQVRIRRDYAPDTLYSLMLDIQPDGFDPASADRERLGSVMTMAGRKTEVEARAR